MRDRLLLNPVAAYDRIAPEFARISNRRRAYLEAVEREIISRFPSGGRSLLDVGAGDGKRSLRIARACGVSRLVWLEPSAAMRGSGSPGVETWTIRAEELGAVQEEFDVITCLWNVLGHIHPADTRAQVLGQFARLATRDGLVFVDVNHRYNAAQYGVWRTTLRYLHDRLRPHERNGDVVAGWQVAGASYAARGHVFTDREFRSLARRAGLEVRERVVIDYSTGQIQQRNYQGNLLYVLAKASVI